MGEVPPFAQVGSVVAAPGKSASKRLSPPPSKTCQPTSASPPTRRTVAVLGAGADVVHNVPTVNSLVRELATFALDEGAPIHKALKGKIKNLRFGFDQLAGNRRDSFISDLFAGSTDVTPQLRSGAAKLQRLRDFRALGNLIERFCGLADRNLIAEPDVKGLARLTAQACLVGWRGSIRR